MRDHATLRIIREEHMALSAVLRSIGLLLSESRRRGLFPDCTVLRAMLFYIDEFPERVHHPKETELLFPKVRQRSDLLTDVLARLDDDHARTHAAVRDLEHQVLGLEMMGDGPDGLERLRRFEKTTEDYITGYLAHLRLEEREVLPLAENVLTAADWDELDAAFMANRDPLTLREPDDQFRPLFKKILTTLPSPIGLGPAMEALRAMAPGRPS